MQTKLQYILGCIAEEAAEVAQRAIKAQRFGLYETQPTHDADNLERLRGEALDLMAMFEILNENLSSATIRIDPVQAVENKKAKFRKYYSYSQSLGEVE